MRHEISNNGKMVGSHAMLFRDLITQKIFNIKSLKITGYVRTQYNIKLCSCRKSVGVYFIRAPKNIVNI